MGELVQSKSAIEGLETCQISSPENVASDDDFIGFGSGRHCSRYGEPVEWTPSLNEGLVYGRIRGWLEGAHTVEHIVLSPVADNTASVSTISEGKSFVKSRVNANSSSEEIERGEFTRTESGSDRSGLLFIGHHVRETEEDDGGIRDEVEEGDKSEGGDKEPFVAVVKNEAVRHSFSSGDRLVQTEEDYYAGIFY